LHPPLPGCSGLLFHCLPRGEGDAGSGMFGLRERVNQRRVLAKPCFQDFDK